jgi:hypothetical protein
MSPEQRLGIEVADAIARVPADSAEEIVVRYEAVVAAATEAAYVALVTLGVGDRDARRLLGVRPERPVN